MEDKIIPTTEYDAGVYILELLLPEERDLIIGRLGKRTFEPGYYYYVGSAQQNLKHRIHRHLRTEKTIRWHIDYLLQVAQILQVYTWPGEKSMECILGKYMQDFPACLQPIPGFGASDCKCKSHLFYFSYRPHLANLVHVVQEELHQSASIHLLG